MVQGRDSVLPLLTLVLDHESLPTALGEKGARFGFLDSKNF
jgi:hypothetical protein